MTKQFTATLVLLEQEEGKLSVDDPIRKYLPDAPAAWDKITIGDLLHHTSGLPNFIFDKRFFEWRMVARTPVEEMDLFKDKPLNFAPGTQWEYSNSNYMLLGMILEKVTGRRYVDLLQEHILAPLGMKDSSAALGAYPWRTTLSVLYPAARSGIVTGLLLAIARISGETAPLLFTALNNQFWSTQLNAPMANLPVVIFQFALSPYKKWQDLAWAGALIITVTILVLSISARIILALMQSERGSGR